MSLDIRIQPLAFDAKELKGEDGQSEVLTTVVAGLFLPFATDPSGTPAVTPLMNIRWSLRKNDALEFGKKISEVASTLPDESDIAIATDLSAVDRLAKATEQLKKG